MTKSTGLPKGDPYQIVPSRFQNVTPSGLLSPLLEARVVDAFWACGRMHENRMDTQCFTYRERRFLPGFWPLTYLRNSLRAETVEGGERCQNRIQGRKC